jgi:hypothetical protein
MKNIWGGNDMTENDKHERRQEKKRECDCVVVITGGNRLVKLCGDKEKKLKLFADGIPRGGKYEWSIIHGDNKVEIAGSKRQKLFLAYRIAYC